MKKKLCLILGLGGFLGASFSYGDRYESVAARLSLFAVGVGVKYFLGPLTDKIVAQLPKIGPDEEYIAKQKGRVLRELESKLVLTLLQKDDVSRALDTYARRITETQKINPIDRKRYLTELYGRLHQIFFDEKEDKELYKKKHASITGLARAFSHLVTEHVYKKKMLITSTVRQALRRVVKATVLEGLALHMDPVRADVYYNEYVVSGMKMARITDIIQIPVVQEALNVRHVRSIVGGTALYCGPRNPHCVFDHDDEGQTWYDIMRLVGDRMLTFSITASAIPITGYVYKASELLASSIMQIGAQVVATAMVLPREQRFLAVTTTILNGTVQAALENIFGSMIFKEINEAFLGWMDSLGIDLSSQEVINRTFSWWQTAYDTMLSAGNIGLMGYLVSSQPPLDHHHKHRKEYDRVRGQ